MHVMNVLTKLVHRLCWTFCRTLRWRTCAWWMSWPSWFTVCAELFVGLCGGERARDECPGQGGSPPVQLWHPGWAGDHAVVLHPAWVCGGGGTPASPQTGQGSMCCVCVACMCVHARACACVHVCECVCGDGGGVCVCVYGGGGVCCVCFHLMCVCCFMLGECVLSCVWGFASVCCVCSVQCVCMHVFCVCRTWVGCGNNYNAARPLTCTHTPSIAFRHPPPNSARFGYATEGALSISAQLSTDMVSALQKIWKQPSAQACM